MKGKLKIYFRGVPYFGYKDLVDSWEKKYPSEFPVDPSSFATNLRKWKKKNPGKNLPDEIIEKYLITRKYRNSITYKGTKYSGPKKLFEALGSLPKISYKGFHLNLQKWKSENPNSSPSDSQIESLIDCKREKTEDGRRLSPNRHKWEKLPNPKVDWPRLAQKLADFRVSESREPSNNEFQDLALPDSEWLDDKGTQKYRKPNDWLISTEEFYNLQQITKTSLNAWRKRIHSYYKRTGRRVTPEIALELMKPYGVVDRSVGILYRWTNMNNGKVYIGITTETLKERIRGHLRTVNKEKYSPNSLHYTIANEGIEVFNIEELETFEDLGELAEAEIKSISEHDCVFPKGYNLDIGGKGVGLRKIPMEFRGKFYKNLVALAEDYDIPVKRLESRLRWKWTIDDAVDIPKGFMKDKPYHKISNEKITELAKKHGISYKKVYERISNYGWTLEEALGIIKRDPVGGKAKAVKVNGISFRSHRKAAKHFGITESAWRKRLKLGWSLEEAAGLVSRPRRKRSNSNKS